MTRQQRSKRLQDAYTLSCSIRRDAAELENILQELEDGGCPPSTSIKEYMAGVGQDAIMLQACLMSAVSLALNWKEAEENEES